MTNATCMVDSLILYDYHQVSVFQLVIVWFQDNWHQNWDGRSQPFRTPGLTIMKFSSTIFILQNCPIRRKYLLNAVFCFDHFVFIASTNACFNGLCQEYLVLFQVFIRVHIVRTLIRSSILLTKLKIEQHEPY